MATAKKLLNVGGGRCRKIPAEYDEYEQLVLDIDASAKPDIIWDALELKKLEESQFDLVYCSHNLEHFYHHQVPVVLAGILHVLKPGGVAHIRVPDVVGAFRMMLDSQFDLTDTLYRTKYGYPVTALDVIYGWDIVIEESGQPWYAHKTGFSVKSLHTALGAAGFEKLEIWKSAIELKGIGYKPSNS